MFPWYSLNINVRKRFIGDQNGVLSIRGNSVFQNARTLVFADGVNLTDLTLQPMEWFS